MGDVCFLHKCNADVVDIHGRIHSRAHWLNGKCLLRASLVSTTAVPSCSLKSQSPQLTQAASVFQHPDVDF